MQTVSRWSSIGLFRRVTESGQCLSNQLVSRDNSLTAAYQALFKRLHESEPTGAAQPGEALAGLVSLQVGIDGLGDQVALGAPQLAGEDLEHLAFRAGDIGLGAVHGPASRSSVLLLNHG